MSVPGTTKLGAGAVGAAALVMLLSACGSGSSSATQAAGSTSGAGQSRATVTEPASALKTTSTSAGTVLVDKAGHTVYELVGDSATASTCTGGCLTIWPAVMKNGHQVVVNGHPLYTYVRDTSAGQATGQNVSDQWGRWLALDASGNPIGAGTASTPSQSATTAPNGGSAAF